MQRSVSFPTRLSATRCKRRIFSGFRSSTILPAFSRTCLARNFSQLKALNMNEAATESVGNYHLIKRVKPDFTDVVLSKWKSKVTGLTVIHIDCEAPIVRGHFVVPTEIFDDSGCPHTLEHLVFLGSEKYPYKGALDLFANRAFADGTNAWTGVDHTAYTLMTAGGQGFLQLLPIYVDHILYPTITDAGFVTEVHHIDGKGNDSGVVYSEMQGRQNTSGDLMALRLRRLLDPPGSGYRSETGGLMEALRILTPEQIRQYHTRYYVPNNLTLIVAGKLSEGTSSLLRVVSDQVEPNLIRHNQNKGSRPDGWKRPFMETPSAQRKPIPVTTKAIVDFPDDKDESTGSLLVNFIGPPPTDFLTRRALKILGVYLTSTEVSPLRKEYIELESPLCSDIYFDVDARATCVDLPIYIEGIPTGILETFNEMLSASLKRIVENGIDLQRMTIVINKEERQLRAELENSPGDSFLYAVLEDLLYGAEDGSGLHPAMNKISHYHVLRTWTNSQWVALLSKYYVEKPSVVVVGKPSSSFADNLEKAEKARIADQIENLGPEGLKKVELQLEAAKAENDKPLPTDILTSFPIPDVSGISWIPVQSAQEPGKGRGAEISTTGELQRHIEADGEALPFFVEYDHVNSDFVSIRAFLSLAKLPDRLRPYMTAYSDAFFSLPVVRHNGVRLTYEEVINQLENDTVAFNASIGLQGFSQTLVIQIEVEVAEYESGVAWLRDLIYGSEFEKERIQIVLSKIQAKLPELKRIGSTVLSSLFSDLIYAENSTSRFEGVLQQTEFNPKLLQRFRESPDDVLADFESIRKHVIDPSGVRFSVGGNVLGLKHHRRIWAKYFANLLPPTQLCPVPLTHETLSAVGRNCSGKAIVMSLPTVESSFVTHVTNGIQGFDHPEYPVVRLAAEVLNGTESYLWRSIRGSGLAYGAYVSVDVEGGLLKFSLYRSSNSLKAFEVAASLIRGLVDGLIELEETIVDAAKSSIVYRVTEDVATPGDAALVFFVNQALKGVPGTHGIDLLKKYQSIGNLEILAALRKYFLPLFDSASSAAAIVTAPGNAQSIEEGLKSLGFDVTRKELNVEPADLDIHDDDSESGTSSMSA